MNRNTYNGNLEAFYGQPMKYQEMVYKREQVVIKPKTKEYVSFPCECAREHSSRSHHVVPKEKYKLIFPN